MKKRILLIKTIISVGLLSLLFSKVDWGVFYSGIKGAHITFIIISALMVYLGVYISILKWGLFLENYGIIVNKFKLYSIYSIGTFFNNFLPTTIGGDFYRILKLTNKFKDRKKEILSSIILERGFGFLSLFLINFLLLPFYYRFLFLNKNFLFIQIIVACFFIALIFLMLKSNFLISLKDKLFKKEILIINKFQSLIVSIKNIKKKRIIIYALFNSIIFGLLIGIARYVLFLAFGIEIDFLYVLLAGSIIQIVGILPISLNSLGVTEGLSVFLFGLVGVPLEISLIVALIGRVSMLITSSIGGLFYFIDDSIGY